MRFDPGAHHLLLVDMNGLVLCALFGATSVSNPDVGIESSEGFDRNLLQDARVAPRVEMHGAALGHDLASPRGGRGVNNGAPIRIAKEIERDLVAPLIEGLALCRLAGGPLRVIRALELVVASRILEQFVDRWRLIVYGRELDLHDALLWVQFELRTELQSCHAIPINMHKMQASRGHDNLHPLLCATVASCQERRLASRFGQPVVSRHRQCSRRIYWRRADGMERGVNAASGRSDCVHCSPL
jgi:hypothetical protein